jgi:hypothetical protein
MFTSRINRYMYLQPIRHLLLLYQFSLPNDVSRSMAFGIAWRRLATDSKILRRHVWKTGSILFHFRYFKECYFIWNLYFYVESAVLTAVTMNVSTSWNITPCARVKFDWSFGGSFRLHLAWLTLRLCRWRRYVTPKCQLTSAGLHCVISQKIQHFSVLMFVSL